MLGSHGQKVRFDGMITPLGENQMKSGPSVPTTIDEYIAGFPREVQARLDRIRAVIRKAAPGAEEKMSYRIPTFTLKGSLVHFGGFKKHVGFYPGASGIANFQTELAAYDSAKGSVQFPFDKPLPVGLIAEIVKFRVKENLERAQAKARKQARAK
jgi:uncharacterized protein YdhG (YjbR/CyaY superfamily)